MDMGLLSRERKGQRNGISFGVFGQEIHCFGFREVPSRNGKESLLRCYGKPEKEADFPWLVQSF